MIFNILKNTGHTGQLKVLTTNKPVNICCFKGNLFIGNYFSYGQSALSGHKTV